LRILPPWEIPPPLHDILMQIGTTIYFMWLGPLTTGNAGQLIRLNPPEFPRLPNPLEISSFLLIWNPPPMRRPRRSRAITQLLLLDRGTNVLYHMGAIRLHLLLMPVLSPHPSIEPIVLSLSIRIFKRVSGGLTLIDLHADFA
jgi:hypothetical protein